MSLIIRSFRQILNEVESYGERKKIKFEEKTEKCMNISLSGKYLEENDQLFLVELLKLDLQRSEFQNS